MYKNSYNKNTAALAANPGQHIVRPGDTMWNISRMYNVALNDLIRANPQITNPNLIFPGQIINIPGSAVTPPTQNNTAEVFRLVNQYRVNAGLPALIYNAEVARVAQAKSQEMADLNYFSHYSPVYGSPFDMMNAFGIAFSAAAENIAKGQRTPADVMNSWMNSPGHRANILNRDFTDIGVGHAYDKSGAALWTQMFIKK